MSGLLALLDDVAAIAKMAAAQVDDIAAHAAKATGKSAGVVVDDAAVTPKYVTGIAAARDRMLATPGPDFSAASYVKTGTVKIEPGPAPVMISSTPSPSTSPQPTHTPYFSVP